MTICNTDSVLQLITDYSKPVDCTRILKIWKRARVFVSVFVFGKRIRKRKKYLWETHTLYAFLQNPGWHAMIGGTLRLVVDFIAALRCK